MTTPLAAAQARHQQATAVLADAEHALAKAMRAAGITIPWYATAADMATWRLVESRLEHPATAGTPLARAHGAFRRAENAERKARSALHRARFDVGPPAGTSIGPAAMTAQEVLAGLRERRAA